MRTLFVASLAIVATGCIPRVPLSRVISLPRVAPVPKIAAVPRANVAAPKAIPVAKQSGPLVPNEPMAARPAPLVVSKGMLAKGAGVKSSARNPEGSKVSEAIPHVHLPLDERKNDRSAGDSEGAK